jgi:hypothetical protein
LCNFLEEAIGRKAEAGTIDRGSRPIENPRIDKRGYRRTSGYRGLVAATMTAAPSVAAAVMSAAIKPAVVVRSGVGMVMMGSAGMVMGGSFCATG